VEEVLRLDPPVLLTGRMAMAGTEVAGVPMRHGSVMVALLAGANRDPQVFPPPETFDVTRQNARDHLSFSAGRHFCLGAALARMEGEVGLRTLFERYPDPRVQNGAVRTSTRILRGYERLPVTLSP
jgi:cytochrome P450